MLIAANDNGSTTQSLGALLSPVCLAQGITYYLQTDGFEGATGNLSVQVNYLGLPPPATLSCPPNQTQSALFSDCEAFVTIPLPTIIGDCSFYSFTNDYTQTQNASAVYPVGTTTVTYALLDAQVPTTCSFTVTVVDPLPTTVQCQDVSIVLNASGTASIGAFDVFDFSDGCFAPISLLSVTPNQFTCADVGVNTVTLLAQDTQGNTADCSAFVTLTDNLPPIAQCQNIAVSLNAGGNASITTAQINNSSSDNCGIVQFSVLPNTFVCANLGQNTVTLTATDGANNSASCQATVTVTDITPPIAVCQNATVLLNASGTASLTPAQINNGSTDNCSITNLALSKSVFTCIDLGQSTTTLTVTDIAGNTATCQATITVGFQNPPTPLCQNISVNLNAVGTVSINVNQIFSGSTDVCLTVVPQTVLPNAFTCDNIGTNVVTLSAIDAIGNTSTCQATVNVSDNLPPVMSCQNIAVNLNSLGNAGITAAQINNNSTDNCAINNLTALPNAFTCANIGQNTVVLTATDVSGNAATCSAIVTIADNLPPTATCQNISIDLDLTGNAAITPAQINNGSTDNCAISNLSVSPNTFTCANIGNNTVALTVTDTSGNTGTCQANVFVVFTAQTDELCQNITVFLSPSGNAAILPSDVFIGSTDDCGGISPISVFPNNFTCSNIGNNVVTLTVNDILSNTSSCQANVAIADNLPPVVQCQNITVSLNVGGNASITAAQINNGSTDNCAISTLSVFPNAFTCANLGQNTVVLTVNDASGNSSTCSAIVTITDNLPPTAICQNITIDLDLTGNAAITPSQINNGSIDNCAISNLNVLPNTFTCANIGNNTVVLTVTDTSGNTGTCQASVFVVFTAQPDELCQNITVSLSGTGNASITPNDVFIGNNDECGGISPLSVFPNAFTCTQLGTNTVTLTVSNIIGNTSTCQATVMVNDNIHPVAQCQNQNVNLSNGGNASVTAAQINNGSTDNCQIASFGVLPNAFTCSNTGTNTVTLTVLDTSGNSSTCQAVVNVSDVLPPVALCQNLNVVLDLTGNVSITSAQINNNSTDNCQISNLTVLPNAFGCANVGNNTVTLTVTDTSGNTATCQATVQVIFNPPPINVCQNFAVNLNAAGNAGILPAHVFAGGSDACGAITPLSVAPNSFTCANIGNNTVTLTTANGVGHTSTCQATVSISDVTVPTIQCPSNISVTNSLNNCGTSIIVPLPVATDNCTTITLSNNVTGVPSASGFYVVGVRTVNFTATDISGNTATCTFTVTVTDTQAPTITCPSNVSVNASGCTQAITWSPPSASDNCAIGSVNSNFTSGAVFNLGTSTVTYTATDIWSNTATCSFTVSLADVTPPTMTCPANLNQTTTVNCTAIVNWTSPTPQDNCSTVNISNVSHPSGSSFNAGTTTVTYTAADSWGNTTTCSFTVTITDAQPPIIECPEDRTISTSPTTCNAAVLITPPQASDNCSSVSLTNNYTNAPNASSIYPLGTTVVTYSASDVAGNTVSCSFTITVVDLQPPIVQCPANITQNLSGTNCFGVVIVPLATASDNCSSATLTNSLTGTANASGAYLIGQTIITYTAADAVGNTSTCSFTVNVQDSTPPVMPFCPSNISTNVPAGVCTATATWNTPFANDNCSAVTVTPSIPSGSTFNTGTTIVVYTASDSGGNTTTCTFSVTVVDNQPPTITCPPNMVSCTNYPTWPLPQYNDACVVSGVVANKTPGAFMSQGINTVTYTVTDGSSNTATCSFTISVAPPITIILSTANYGAYNLTCNGGSNGIITALVGIGGVPPFTYLWSNGATSNLLNGLSAGQYSVTVTDAIGCSGQNIVTLTQPPPINCSMTTNPASCAGTATGSANVSVTGGGAFLTYHWSGPNGPMPGVGSTQNNLIPGVYQVTATTTSGCTCVTSGTVGSFSATSQLSGNMTTSISGVAPFLFNFSQITFTGGTIPYTFTWITAGYVQYSSNNTGISVIYTGTSYWSVTVSDNNPCTEGTLVFSNAPEINTGILSIVSATTNGDTGSSNGSISLLVVGGNPCSTGGNYQYTWNGPATWVPTGNTNSPNLNGLPSGWFIVTVIDCGPDGIPNSGDEQVTYGYYWIPKAVRGRGKAEDGGSLQIHPNPIAEQNSLLFVLPENDYAQVWIYDLIGRKVMCLFNGQVTADTPQQLFFSKDLLVKDGIYICRVETASGYSLQERIIVVR